MQLWLPLWPLQSDDLMAGLFRGSRDTGMRKRWIEANPQAVSNLLVVDVDHDDATMRLLWDRKDLQPNVVTVNPDNGHAHAIWALQEAVTRTEYARRKPLAYAAAVTEGLRRSVDGDKGYSGLITKNPLHASWDTLPITDRLWTLPELADALQARRMLPTASWQRSKRQAPVGLGRNCTLFETARHWAYREIRHHFGNPQGLGTAIETHAHQLNADYSEPLPRNEVHHLAASITRWITTRSTMWNDGPAVYEANFTLIQHHRGTKSAQQRRTTAHERAALLEDELWQR